MIELELDLAHVSAIHERARSEFHDSCEARARARKKKKRADLEQVVLAQDRLEYTPSKIFFQIKNTKHSSKLINKHTRKMKSFFNIWKHSLIIVSRKLFLVQYCYTWLYTWLLICQLISIQELSYVLQV
jgi:hypothetical protein